MRSKKILLLIGFMLTLLGVWLTTSCSDEAKDRKLAELYCGGCHLYPEPSLLTKQLWKDGVFPQMAIRMGLTPPDLTVLEYDEYKRLLAEGGLPSKPLISQADWDQILNYYLRNAPDQLSQTPTDPALRLDSTLFKSEAVWSSPDGFPNLSMLKCFPKSQQLVAGFREGKVLIFDSKNLVLQDSVGFPSSPSDARIGTNGKLNVLLMGNMDPNDWFTGSLVEVNKVANKWELLRIWHKQLNRPVHLNAADLNQDGQEDWIISEFGHYLGKLAWYEKNGQRVTKTHDLMRSPGFRVAQVVDLDRDGLKDIVALVAQGDERIMWFRNQGEGGFETQQLARFLPIYGSSYLEVQDINQDGHLDLIHTCGDNYDYSYTLKPFHGIRVLVNNGKQAFQEAAFLPMNGAGKVLADDFDQDGDLDLAGTAYFPDYRKQPMAGFVLFRNKGQLKFEALTYPLTDAANWLLMEKGDVDQDGDVDLLLGACSINNTVPESLRKNWRKRGLGILLLRNQSKVRAQ